MYKLESGDENYMVLPCGEVSDIESNEIAIGVCNYSLIGKKVLEELEYNGNIYKWVSNKCPMIPDKYYKLVCIQVYRLVR